jgi:hypothetical protein
VSALQSGRADLVGPVTNAPGHKPKQQIATILKGYKITDDRTYINQVQHRLLIKNGQELWPGLINGFCMVAKTSTWFKGVHSPDNVFNPKHKMTKNEDDLQGRWLKQGMQIKICPASFVWHYRSVTRKPSGRCERGAFRIKD